MEIEKRIGEDLQRYLRSEHRLEGRLPECPDLEELWPAFRDAYMPDGVREFGQYPVVSLGWMMFVGMAMAKFWDVDWEKYGSVPAADMYVSLRDARGYDNMDDYILRDIIGLDEAEAEKTSAIVGACAARVHHFLLTDHIEPGTAQAAEAYSGALHQLYLAGIYIGLDSLGYRMTKLG